MVFTIIGCHDNIGQQVKIGPTDIITADGLIKNIVLIGWSFHTPKVDYCNSVSYVAAKKTNPLERCCCWRLVLGSTSAVTSLQ